MYRNVNVLSPVLSLMDGNEETDERRVQSKWMHPFSPCFYIRLNLGGGKEIMVCYEGRNSFWSHSQLPKKLRATCHLQSLEIDRRVITVRMYSQKKDNIFAAFLHSRVCVLRRMYWGKFPHQRNTVMHPPPSGVTRQLCTTLRQMAGEPVSEGRAICLGLRVISDN